MARRVAIRSVSLLLLSSAHPTVISAFLSHVNNRPTRIVSCLPAESKEDDTFTCYVPKKLPREEAQRVMDETILPSREYDKRIQYGGEAQDFQSQIVTADDPRTAFTYGEFPPSSMDQLIDLALAKHLPKDRAAKEEITLIDLGSGCGRLVLYSALTRGFEEDVRWTVHGIEISPLLHDEALRASLAGLDNDWFQVDQSTSDSSNQFVLHCGPANDFPSLFRQTDIIFAYSTVWANEGFSEELGAIIMSREWNQLLSSHCRPGTIAITTDRALDPNFGWKLVDKLDVDNREVFGSTGYIHILQP